MNKYLNNLMFLLPVMFYYAIEALVVGLLIAIIWKYFLSSYFGFLGYPQIVAIYWIIKMLLFDVFKLIFNIGANQEPIDNND